MQQIGDKAVDLVGVNTVNDEFKDRKTPNGELILGIRVDGVPASEAKRLAAEGNFYPLTTDKDGNLRVRVPDGLKVETEELAVLREIKLGIDQLCELMMRIASS